MVPRLCQRLLAVSLRILRENLGIVRRIFLGLVFQRVRKQSLSHIPARPMLGLFVLLSPQGLIQ